MTAPQPPPPWTQPPTVKVKRPINPWMIIGWIILGSLVLCGGGCGAVILLGASTTTTTTGPPIVVAGGNTTVAPPTSVGEVTTTAAPYVPVPTDFAIEVIELERSCFGSAGCNVTFTIAPTYVGAVPAVGDFQVLYDVQGAESAKTGNFSVVGGEFVDLDRDVVQVPTGAVLAAVPTRVLPGSR